MDARRNAASPGKDFTIGADGLTTTVVTVVTVVPIVVVGSLCIIWLDGNNRDRNSRLCSRGRF